MEVADWLGASSFSGSGSGSGSVPLPLPAPARAAAPSRLPAPAPVPAPSRLRLRLRLFFLLLGRLLLLRRGGVTRADHGQLGADLDGLVLLDLDLQQLAGDGRGDLGVDLVGGDLEQRLVDRYVVTDRLQPAGDRALGDGLAESGQLHRGRLATASTAAVAALGGGCLLLFLLRLGLRLGLLLRLGLWLWLGLGLRFFFFFFLLRLGLRLGLLLGLGLGLPAGVARGFALVADDRQDRAHLDRVVLLRLDLQQGAGDRRRDLGVDFVGGDLEQRLIHGDGVPYRLQPAGDGAFGDALAEGREVDFGGHVSASCSSRGQEWACRGLPARARWASPSASFWVGWAWTRGATSSA